MRLVLFPCVRYSHPMLGVISRILICRPSGTVLACALASLITVVGCTPNAPPDTGQDRCLPQQVSSAVERGCRQRCDGRAFRQCNNGIWECRCAPPTTEATHSVPVATDNLGASSCDSSESWPVMSATDRMWSVRRECVAMDGRPTYRYVLTNGNVALEVPGDPIAFSPSSRIFLFEGRTTTDERQHFIQGISMLELGTALPDFGTARRITNRITSSEYLRLLREHSDPSSLPQSFSGFFTPDDPRRLPRWTSVGTVDVPTTRGWIHVDLNTGSASSGPP